MVPTFVIVNSAIENCISSPHPLVEDQHEHLHSEMIGYCTCIHVQYFCLRKPWQYHRRKILLIDFTGLQDMPSGKEHERSEKQFPSFMYRGQNLTPKSFHVYTTGQCVYVQSHCRNFLLAFFPTLTRFPYGVSVRSSFLISLGIGPCGFMCVSDRFTSMGEFMDIKLGSKLLPSFFLRILSTKSCSRGSYSGSGSSLRSGTGRWSLGIGRRRR